MYKTSKYLLGFVGVILGVFGLLMLPKLVVHAAALTGGSASLSDSRISTSSTYTLSFSGATTGTLIRCVKLEFDTQSDGAGGLPTGMNISSPTYVAADSTLLPDVQTWTASGSGDSISITNATGENPIASGSIAVSGITNGSTAETSYFLIFKTYTDASCTGGNEVDTATVTFVFTQGQLVSLTVDPSLTFSITEVASGQSVNGATTDITTTDGTIPFTGVSAGAGGNGIGAHSISVGTNSSGGYTVYIRYTGALTANGTDTITDWTGSNATPTTIASTGGTELFGYTTADSTLSTGAGATDRFTSAGGNKWAAFTTNNAEVAYGAGVGSETLNVGYQVGISSTTEAGNYSTTVIYTATPTY